MKITSTKLIVLLLGLSLTAAFAQTTPLPATPTPPPQAGEPTNTKEAEQKKKASKITPAMQAAEEKRMATMSPDELAWEKVLQENLGDFYLSGYYWGKDNKKEGAFDYVADNPALPRMLIIGDSISRGYTVATRHALAGKVNVHRAPANCGPTKYGLEKLDVWLGKGKWDVITVNFGIHDRNTDPAIYRANLEQIIQRLQKTGAQVVWVRTTPAPDGPCAEKFTETLCNRLNQAGDEVAAQYHLTEIDLYGLVKPKQAELQLPNNVHFKNEGYDLMGAEVARVTLEVLKGMSPTVNKPK